MKFATAKISASVFFIIIFKETICGVCFPETEEVTCRSCSFEYYNDQGLFSKQNRLISRSSCKIKNRSFSPSRRILVGNFSEHAFCDISENFSLSTCLILSGFKSNFDWYYSDLFSALDEENKLLNPFMYASLNIFLFGRIEFFSKNIEENLEFFRRLNINVTILPLECVKGEQFDLCKNYSLSKPIIIFQRRFMPTIYIAGIFLIQNIDLFFSSSFNASLGQTLFHLESIPDDPLSFVPELNLRSCNLYTSAELWDINFIRMHPGGTLRWVSAIIVEIMVANPFIEIFTDYEDFDYNEYISISMVKETRVELVNLSFQSMICAESMGQLFGLTHFTGTLIIQDISFFNLTCYYVSSLFFIYQVFSDKTPPVLSKISFLDSISSTIVRALNSDIYIYGVSIYNTQFSNNKIFSFEQASIVDIKGLVLFDCNKNSQSVIKSNNSASAPLVWASQITVFSLHDSKFVNSSLVDCEVRGSVFSVYNSMFINANFINALITGFEYSTLIENCVFNNVSGEGVIFNQFKGDLNIYSIKMSLIKALVIINFEDLTNNIIANSLFIYIQNPQYFWTRNLQVRNQVLLNNTFTFCYFLRIQSLYRAFPFFPKVLHKNCTFSNMLLGYGFDYCCLELTVINTNFNNIELVMSALYSIEIDGRFYYDNSSFINVGWKKFNYATLGGLIGLWYPYLFVLNNCNFLITMELSLRAGYITSRDMDQKIIVNNSRFIVQNPSLYFPVKGILFFSIKEIFISNCTFINITCDFYQGPQFYHINGAIIFLGAASFFEKVLTDNTFHLQGINVSNPISKNGAGLTVVSYKQGLIENCTFFSGKAIGGNGGLIAIVFVQELKINFSNFKNGSSISGGLLYLKDITLLTIHDSVFANSSVSESGGCILLLSNVNIFLTNVSFFNCSSENQGGLIFLLGGKLELNNINSSLLFSGTGGGALYLDNFDALVIMNSIFKNLETKTKGGLLFGEGRNLTIFNITLEEGKSAQDGTLMFLENFYVITITNCWFQDSYCMASCKGGFFMFNTFFEGSLMTIENIHLSNMTSDGDLFLILSDIQINIDKFTVILWTGKKLFNLMGLKFLISVISNLEISNSITYGTDMFEFTKLTLDARNIFLTQSHFGLNLLKINQAEINIDKISLTNMKVNLSDFSLSSIIYVYESKMIFSNFHIVIKLMGLLKISKPSLFILFDSDLFLSNLNCEVNDMMFIYSTDSDLSIESSFMLTSNLDWEASRFHLTSGGTNYLEIKSSNFSFPFGLLFEILGFELVLINNSGFNCSKETVVFYCQAILGKQINSISLENSSFTNLASRSGATLELSSESACNIFLDFSNFINCTSDLGGAIFITCNPTVMIITNSNFLNNQAMPYLRSAIANSGIGGSIFVACPHSLENCSVSISKSYFFNNFALNYAATIFSNFAIQVSEDNVFENNTDINGLITDYFSYPLKLKIIQNGKISPFITFTSGLAENITILLTDFFENLLSFDSESFARIQVKTSVSAVALQNSIAICKQGVFHFPNLLIKSYSGRNLTLNLLLEFFRDPLVNHKKIELDVPVVIRKCLLGEIVEIDMTCRKCQRGTYSFEEPSSAKECKKCPDNFECLGGDLIYPKNGYWREGLYSTLAVKCLMEAACLGGTKENMTDTDKEHGACAEGHFGNLCFECAKGYGKFDSQNLCENCNKEKTMLVAKVTVVLVCIILFVLLNGYIMSRDLKPKGEQSNFILFKMIFTHFQTITIIAFMEDTSAFPSMQEFLRVLSYISFIKDDILSLDCFFDDKQNAYLYKTIIVVVLPFLLGTLAMVFWLLFALLYKIYSKRAEKHIIFIGKISIESFRNKELNLKRVIISFAIGAYSFYPLILQSAFTLPNCISLRKGSDLQYLYASPNVKCWTDVHLNFIYFVFLPAVMLWGGIFPLSLKYILMISRGANKDPKSSNRTSLEKRTIHSSNKKRSQRFISIIEYKIFRFFYEDYKYEYYYWEAVIFMKKFLLTALSSLRNLIGQDTKFILIILVLAIYGNIIMKTRPFIFEICNTYEIISTSVIGTTALLLIIINNERSFGVIFMLGLLTFSFNVLFISTLLLASLRNFIKRLLAIRKFIPFKFLTPKSTVQKKQLKSIVFTFKDVTSDATDSMGEKRHVELQCESKVEISKAFED